MKNTISRLIEERDELLQACKRIILTSETSKTVLRQQSAIEARALEAVKEAIRKVEGKGDE